MKDEKFDKLVESLKKKGYGGKTLGEIILEGTMFSAELLLVGGGITPEQRSGLAQRIGRAVDFASRVGLTKDEIEISGINGIFDARIPLREGNRGVEKI